MHKLYFSQKIPISLEQGWEFFSNPLNLEKITPPHLALKINHCCDKETIYPGQIIAYTVEPLWKIPMEWITEIVAVQKPVYFIDEQRFGPYTFWHHEHWFTSVQNGIFIEDIIYYKVPFGIIGKAFHHIKIKKDLYNIFSYRNQVLEKLFGLYKLS